MNLKTIIGRLLYLANTSPPGCGRDEFYAMKDWILARYGTPDGTDVQHIVSECWGNWHDDTGCQGAKCLRCGGTGVYEEKWILLQRWKIGHYSFHSKPTRIWKTHYAFKEPTIEGCVEHADHGRMADEAMLWLALLTGHWSLWWRQSAHTYRYGRKLWPLLNLACFCWLAARFYDRIRARRCHCGRTYRRWFGGRGWCRECRKPRVY